MKYFIVPFDEVTDEMLQAAQEDGVETLRHSMHGVDRVILKVAGTVPEAFFGRSSYTKEQLKVELKGPDWNL